MEVSVGTRKPKVLKGIPIRSDVGLLALEEHKNKKYQVNLLTTCLCCYGYTKCTPAFPVPKKGETLGQSTRFNHVPPVYTLSYPLC